MGWQEKYIDHLKDHHGSEGERERSQGRSATLRRLCEGCKEVEVQEEVSQEIKPPQISGLGHNNENEIMQI